MAIDHRLRPKRRKIGLPVLAVVVSVAVTGWFFHRDWLQKREEAIATAKTWTIEGPACPTLTREGFIARGGRTLKSFDYAGARFSRQFGHVDCASVGYDGGRGPGAFPVCQFTSPGLLQVVTPRGEFFFAPGAGQAATISVPRGEARCVVAANFRLGS